MYFLCPDFEIRGWAPLIQKGVANKHNTSYFLLYPSFPYLNYPLFVRDFHPVCCWLILPIQNDAKNLKSDRDLGTWVLICEFSARAFQWIPIWQDLDGFQKSLRPCALDVSSLSIGRVKVDQILFCKTGIETCHNCSASPASDRSVHESDAQAYEEKTSKNLQVKTPVKQRVGVLHVRVKHESFHAILTVRLHSKENQWDHCKGGWKNNSKLYKYL